MAGTSYRAWYVKPAVKFIHFSLAGQAALMALALGGIIGWMIFCVGAFAMFEFALWADGRWPEMRD